MPKLLKSIFLLTFLLFFCSTFVSAEDITITTYYPSPYGSYKNLNIYNQDESATQTDFTGALTKAGLIITTDYTDTAFTPGIFWSTGDNNPTLPKAGIYLKETNVGTNMYFGTSNNYATGITNDALVIDPSGKVGIGTTAPVGKLDVNGSLASTAWTNVTFAAGWSNYAGGYQAVQYKKFGDLVFLRGLASSGANLWASYPIIFTLPAGHRPTGGRLIFDQMANANQSVRVDIEISGNVTYLAGGAGSNWLNLDGIVFSVD